MKKLAIITTHPIQYYAPVFKLLHQRQQMAIKVFYTWGENAVKKYDPGFNKEIEWDIPLLDGYPYEWVVNTSKNVGSHYFNGIMNPRLIDQINEWQPDALLVYGWGYRSHLKVLRHFKNKIPVFFRGDSTLLDYMPRSKSILRTALLKWVYRNVDHAFYVGLNNKAYFKKYGLKDEQLTFAPHAIDNDRFAGLRKTESDALRYKAGIPADAILVLFAGKLEEKKAPSLLLDAFLQLKQVNLHLLFVGNGQLEQQLKETAAGNANIHFMDFFNQSLMPVVYQACDLFCLPAKGPGETWGLAVNEAMACGKAILVSDKVGCAADLVSDNSNGYVFKAGDITDLILKLKKLTENKETLLRYGEQSLIVIRDWNFVNIAKAIEGRLLNEKKRQD